MNFVTLVAVERESYTLKTIKININKKGNVIKSCVYIDDTG